MIWKAFMTEALQNTPVEDFPSSETGPKKAPEPESPAPRENWEVPTASRKIN